MSARRAWSLRRCRRAETGRGRRFGRRRLADSRRTPGALKKPATQRPKKLHMSQTILLESTQQLVVPLRAKRPLPAYSSPNGQENKLARLDQPCLPCDAVESKLEAPFVLMRMSSSYAMHGPNAFRHKTFTEWLPFTTVASEVRAIYDSLAIIEAEEASLGVCRYSAEAGALYEVEAAILVPGGEDGVHKCTHVAEVDTSGIHLDILWPRIGDWRELESPRVFSR